MLQANPALTPNAEGDHPLAAQVRGWHDPLTRGGGFLNAEGAVRLAEYLRDPSTESYPDSTNWSGGSSGATSSCVAAALRATQAPGRPL
jgi:hypothetical protein